MGNKTNERYVAYILQTLYAGKLVHIVFTDSSVVQNLPFRNDPPVL
jgi:hypothetical protein